jgi:hypothetical protein
MAFNAYDMRNEAAVSHAYDDLRDGGTVIVPLGPVRLEPMLARI